MLLLFQVCVCVCMCVAEICLIMTTLYLFSYLPWFEFFYWALERVTEFKRDLSEVCVCVHVRACVRHMVLVIFVCLCQIVCLWLYGGRLEKWDELAMAIFTKTVPYLINFIYL